MMQTIEILKEIFVQHELIASIVAGFLSEDILLLLVILTANEKLSLLALACGGILGIIIHDAIIFALAKNKYIHNLLKKIPHSKKNKRIEGLIEHIHSNKYKLPLIISKFMYGVRIAYIIYLSTREKRILPYIKYNLIATTIWAAIMIPLAWLAGKGMTRLFSLTMEIQKIAGLIVLSILGVIILNILVSKLTTVLIKNKG